MTNDRDGRKIEKRPIYGEPPPTYGRIFGMIPINGPSQAALFEAVIIKAMAEYAGREEETLLAKWHHDVLYVKRRAKSEDWLGWDTDHDQ